MHHIGEVRNQLYFTAFHIAQSKQCKVCIVVVITKGLDVLPHQSDELPVEPTHDIWPIL